MDINKLSSTISLAAGGAVAKAVTPDLPAKGLYLLAGIAVVSAIPKGLAFLESIRKSRRVPLKDACERLYTYARRNDLTGVVAAVNATKRIRLATANEGDDGALRTLVMYLSHTSLRFYGIAVSV